VQIGVDPRRAVAIVGMRTASDVIRLLDGSRDRERVIAEASERGIPVAVTERVLTLLAAAGVLIDFPASVLLSIPRELRPQLMPELATASLSRQDGDGGGSLLARRSATSVEVRGSGPVAATIADLLTCSGVATLAVPDEPAGPGGRRPPGQVPDLAVLVGHQSPGQAAEFQRQRVPHLVVSASEAIGIVGPLVRPGISACLRCLDLARAQGDPAWPLILAQLRGRAADPAACDAILAAAVAAQAAAQAVAFADRAALAEATASATLELVLPAWQWRRRTWLPHPACTCRAADAGQVRAEAE
jgi:bacteriocin biosynthesis cyclodehydratase domain-containing protein